MAQSACHLTIANKIPKIIEPKKKPPKIPNNPTATQTVLITKKPPRRPIPIETAIEIISPTVVSMNPSIEQTMKVPKNRQTVMIPAVTHGKNLLPNRRTMGPPRIISKPKAQG